MNPRIAELRAQGWQQPEAMYAVEWALQFGQPFSDGGDISCRCCGYIWRTTEPVNHSRSCPIPDLGYAVLREAHWYCTGHEIQTECPKCLGMGYQTDRLFTCGYCGGDGWTIDYEPCGIHEPREGELA